MKLHLVGGFLGAGKTTLIRALARRLRGEGERVVVVTNDQGEALVDTRLLENDREQGPEAVSEISGGCFCCRYDDLENALAAAQGAGATVAIAEAVGSCTDLVATVVSPLTERHPAMEVAPLAVVVDPWRVRQVEEGEMHEEVAYLFRKQIQEADIVLVSRSDLDPPEVEAEVRALAPDAAIVHVSGRTGRGLDDWLSARPTRPASPLAIDYERYAAAEALLGWANGRVELEHVDGFDPGAVIAGVLGALDDAPVAHFKMASQDPPGGSGSLVRRAARPELETASLPGSVRRARFLVNARVALPPEELEVRLKSAVEAVAQGASVRWEGFECFRPAPPEPMHRHAFRCGSGDDASCCAAFYDRAEVRYLLGDSLHPGGVELTLSVVEALELETGDSLLDVACGSGTSLKAIGRLWDLRTVGIDAGLGGSGPSAVRTEDAGSASSEAPAGEVAGGATRESTPVLRPGDVHDLPFEDGAFDAVLCECALSTFADQRLALREMRRVLSPGGQLALSDMLVEGAVPAELEDWVNVGTCLAGALSSDGYSELIESAGFRVRERRDAADALEEMVGRIKRNVLGLALGRATGAVPEEIDIDLKEARSLLRTAEEAIAGGVIGYGVFIAERVD